MQNAINTTEAGLGRLVQLQQEQTSPNHVQAIFSGSVRTAALPTTRRFIARNSIVHASSIHVCVPSIHPPNAAGSEVSDPCDRPHSAAGTGPLRRHPISLWSLLINGGEKRGPTRPPPHKALLSNFLADTKHFYDSLPPEYSSMAREAVITLGESAVKPQDRMNFHGPFQKLFLSANLRRHFGL